ncbi:MAG: hypothetical protein H6698_03630 [Myxococcales bacterium]|nr:hypothetical protein [Myxococcales bacterium]
MVSLLVVALQNCAENHDRGRLPSPDTADRSPQRCETATWQHCVIVGAEAVNDPAEAERATRILDSVCLASEVEACRRLASAAVIGLTPTSNESELWNAVQRLERLCAASPGHELCARTPAVRRQLEEVVRLREAEALEAQARYAKAAGEEPSPLVAASSRADDPDIHARIQRGDVDCAEWERETGAPASICEALNEATYSGRTSPRGRAAIAEYLRAGGLRRIRGYIVARADLGVYEAVMRGYDEYWGVSYPRGRHFLLYTTSTDFVSTGSFDLWATKTGTRLVSLNNGFEEIWDEYEESDLGEAWQAVRDARAGEPTAAAARALLLDLTP